MALDADEIERLASLGYQMSLPEADRLVIDRLLFHGRLNGDIEMLTDAPMFFYAEGELSSVFAEHSFMNGDDTGHLAYEADTPEAYEDIYLAQAPVVHLCRVTIDNPVVLDMAKLLSIAGELGIPTAEHDDFVFEFEDSNQHERELVFRWAKERGYNGAIIVNDSTPVAAGGDWCCKTSYVAFEPRKQVRFAFDRQIHEVCKKPKGVSLFGM